MFVRKSTVTIQCKQTVQHSDVNWDRHKTSVIVQILCQFKTCNIWMFLFCEEETYDSVKLCVWIIFSCHVKN